MACCGESVATRAALEDLGMQVVTFGIASDVASSEEQIRELASLAGDPRAGQRLIEMENSVRSRSRVARVRVAR